MTDLQNLYNVNDDGEVVLVIGYEEGDDLRHSVEHPFGDNPTCPCGGRPASETFDDNQDEEEEA